MRMNDKEKYKDDMEKYRDDKVKPSILVVSGGNVDYDWCSHWLKDRSYDYVIAADHGLEHADKLHLKVDYLLGDYDSVDQNLLDRYRQNTETKTYPREKDYTDTHIALRKAINQDPCRIDLIGVTGTRFDHTMTNIFLLKQTLEKEIPCAIYDRYNRITIHEQSFTIEKSGQYGSYVSILPVTEQVKLTLRGMKYPLTEYELEQGVSICQSNEIADAVATIELQKGIILLFETRD